MMKSWRFTATRPPERSEQAHRRDLYGVAVYFTLNNDFQIVFIRGVFEESNGLLITRVIEAEEFVIVSQDSVGRSRVILHQRTVGSPFENIPAPVFQNVLSAVAVNDYALEIRCTKQASSDEK
jgi:hypothetical protein